MHAVACQAHRSHAWHGEDATALESKAMTVQLDSLASEGENSPAERSLPPGTAHPWEGLQDGGQGVGLPAAGYRDTNSREQHYRKQLCLPLGSVPAVSTPELGPARPGGEGKEKASFFSLSPSSEYRGRERRVWIKMPFLTVSSLKLLLNQRLPRYSLSRGCTHPSQHTAAWGWTGKRPGTARAGALWAMQIASCNQGKGLCSHTHPLGPGLGAHHNRVPTSPAHCPRVLPRVSPTGQRCPLGVAHATPKSMWSCHQPVTHGR